EWSAQRGILGPRNLRHVFRRDTIEVRLHTLLSRIVVHSRLPLFWQFRNFGKSGFIREFPPSTIVCPVRNNAWSLHNSAHTFATSERNSSAHRGPTRMHQSFMAFCTSSGACPNRTP